MRNQQQPQQPTTTVVVQQSPGTSGLAIAGLVFSILGWFTLGLLCIPGAFLSFLALFQRGPKGAAIAGLLVGFPGVLFFAIVGLGFFAVILGFGAAANQAMKEAERRAKQPSPIVEEEVEVAEATEQIEPAGFETVGSHIHGPNDAFCRLTVFYAKPNGTDIAKHVLWIRSQHPTSSIIDIGYYDNRDAAVASRAVPGGFGDNPDKLIPEWTFKHEAADYTFNKSMNTNQLLFRRDVPDGEPSDDSEIISLLSKKNTPSGTMADIDDEDESSNTTYNIEESAPPTVSAGYTDELLKQQEADRAAEREAEKARLKAEEDAKYRIWTSTNGKNSPEAKILSYSNGVITIETRAGKKAKVPLEKLSEGDKEYIAKWRKER
jgi:hypothetical protein